jgi:hypothetical protein
MDVIKAIQDQLSPARLAQIGQSVGQSPEAVKSALAHSLLCSVPPGLLSPDLAGMGGLGNLLSSGKAAAQPVTSAIPAQAGYEPRRGSIRDRRGLTQNESLTMRNMKNYLSGVLFVVVLFFAGVLQAADSKSYQVTGQVLELTSSTIVVQKGNERWELARNNSTKITGDLKTGAKVTVYYTMVASEVEVKEAKPAKDTKTKESKESK